MLITNSLLIIIPATPAPQSVSWLGLCTIQVRVVAGPERVELSVPHVYKIIYIHVQIEKKLWHDMVHVVDTVSIWHGSLWETAFR